MNLKPILKGTATYIPFAYRLFKKGTGGTNSARYCYSVWLRHLVMAQQGGLDTNPRVVAELGPGDSLGLGVAALLSGCERYLAFDILEYASAERNLRIFDELVALFRSRTPIPDAAEFPNVKPHLDSYAFPHGILDDRRLDAALDAARLERIRASLRDTGNSQSLIQYRAPWFDSQVVEPQSVDLILSQAVLEHVDDLPGTYRAMHAWLKPTGFISHQIDFRSHALADEWNGHWTYSDFVWTVVRGRRPYMLNREPHSTHIALLQQERFRIVCDQKMKSSSRLTKQDLAPKYQAITDDDLTTSGAFIQAAP